MIPSSSASVLLALLLLPDSLKGEPSVRLELAEEVASTGQRLPFSIELRADGSFDGAASFDLPPLPKTVILKVGNPVLGSLNEGDVEYFTQRHEFALFSQANGKIELPPITVRFSARKGYTGPSFDHSLETRATSFTIERPPGSEGLGFLVTTPSLSIEESWDPAPGRLEVGAVLKRTISQRAENLTGMALSPPRGDAPDGIRVYASDPEVVDKAERGKLSAQRQDVITYLVQKPGTHTLPAIRYDWWNPDSERLESRTLPSLTFVATAPPTPPPPPSPLRFLWPVLAALFLGGLIFFRHPIIEILSRLRDHLDPPERRACRAFLLACRRNDPAQASQLWSKVVRLNHQLTTSKELESARLELQRHLYGKDPAPGGWSGSGLANAFRDAWKTIPSPPPAQALPPLNS